MLNDKSKKKKSEAVDPYLKINYFDGIPFCFHFN